MTPPRQLLHGTVFLVARRCTPGGRPTAETPGQGGDVVLDEPTDLPEGEEVELVPLDEVLASGGDYLR